VKTREISHHRPGCSVNAAPTMACKKCHNVSSYFTKTTRRLFSVSRSEAAFLSGVSLRESAILRTRTRPPYIHHGNPLGFLYFRILEMAFVSWIAMRQSPYPLTIGLRSPVHAASCRLPIMTLESMTAIILTLCRYTCMRVRFSENLALARAQLFGHWPAR
jgi:hypothetical protein